MLKPLPELPVLLELPWLLATSATAATLALRATSVTNGVWLPMLLQPPNRRATTPSRYQATNTSGPFRYLSYKAYYSYKGYQSYYSYTSY